MTRYERKLFFERLMTLREAYRAETHAPLAMTIEDVLAFASDTYNELAGADAHAAAISAPSAESQPSTTD